MEARRRAIRDSSQGRRLMNFDPTPVVRPRQQVELQMRSAILDGHFKDRERLPGEMELAKRFNVSRTTIREALRSLANAGLVRKVPGAGGGNFVTVVDHHSLGNQIQEGVAAILRLGTVPMREILQVRNFLEVPAARLAATSKSEEQLDGLRQSIDHVKTLELGDPMVIQLDATFHSIIAEASGNRMLSSFVRALHEATRPVQYLHFSEVDGRETILQHIAIVKALSNGDEARAAEAMQAHLDYLEGVPLNPEFSDTGNRNPIMA
jgi:DNA-binding FadR family transcriptional regulator